MCEDVISVTLNSKKVMQPDTKSLMIHIIYSCKVFVLYDIVYVITWTGKDNSSTVFLKLLPTGYMLK